MIIDLNLEGKRVVIAGGGREASRKAEVLSNQGCLLRVYAEFISDDLRRMQKLGLATIIQRRIVDGGFLSELDNIFLALACTNDRELNRRIAETARSKGILVYVADDPEYSDFSQPAVMDFGVEAQVAVSTGGRSPLMSGRLRKKIEPLLRQAIDPATLAQIRLQSILRQEVRRVIADPDSRRKFLESLADDAAILAQLAGGGEEEALRLARARLEDFVRQ